MNGEPELLRREGRAHSLTALLAGISAMCMVAALLGYSTLGLLTSACFGLLALGPPLARRNLSALVPRLPGTLLAVAGQPTRWTLTLDSTRRRTARDVRVVLDEGRRGVSSLAAGWISEVLPNPPGKEQAQPSVQLRPRFPTRGRRTQIDLELRSAWPFGWLEERCRWRVPVDLWILPRVLRLNSAALNRVERGDLDTLSRRSSEGDIYALRGWREGEGLRHVAWKLSARRGQRIVTERRELSQPALRVHLISAMGSLTPTLSYPFENAVMLAASLLSHHAQAGADVQLLLDGQHSEKTQGRARSSGDLLALLRSLCPVRPHSGSVGKALAALPPPGPGEQVWAICAASAEEGHQVPPGIRVVDAPEAMLDRLRLKLGRPAQAGIPVVDAAEAMLEQLRPKFDQPAEAGKP